MAKWYCSIRGKRYGPISEEEIARWIRETRLCALDLVWREGMAQWVTASSVAALAGLFSAQAAPPAETLPPPLPMVTTNRSVQTFVRPHRGGTVLTLGILGLLVCCICGIFAWSMGSSDLLEMAAGRMDRSGEGMTQAGKVCGMISVILTLISVVIFLLMAAAD